MLHVSHALHESDTPPPDAVKELYRAQCNCAYWHGAFGGVYLSFMRGALWHHLLRAEGKLPPHHDTVVEAVDRKSTRLNSSHANISYAVFCLKKKKNTVHL